MYFNNILKVTMILVLAIVSFETYAQKIGKTIIGENGKMIQEIIIDGRPPKVLPEPNKDLPTKKIKGTVYWLDNVPSYDWSYGCSAITVAMQAGYFDNSGHPNIYTGPANGGVQPMTNAVWNAQSSHSGTSECPVAGTAQYVDGRNKKGHADDYWTSMLSTLDPYYLKWTEHIKNEAGYNICTADYMGTNQWNNFANPDGETKFYNNTNGSPTYDFTYLEPTIRDGCHGMKLFYEACGETVIDNFNQYIYGFEDNTLGFTFDQYKSEIDNGNPVIIQVTGHTMLGYGYDNTNELHPLVYLRNTWDQNTTPGSHVMEWGKTYSGMTHFGVSVIHLAEHQVQLDVPQNITTNATGTTLTISWDSTGASSYNIYSSDDPYGTFVLRYNTSNTVYSIPLTSSKLFYYVVSSDSK